MDLHGASIVVTGGASGLGAATAQRLVARGAHVTAADLTAGATAPVGVRIVTADITDAEQLGAVFDAAEEAGPIRGVVHCAGRGGDRQRILDREGRPGELDTFAEVIRVNLLGTYNVLRLGAERIARAEVVHGDRGAIVLTASVAAFDGQIGQTSYTAAKAAVHGMTLVAARDLASWQIRVNTIAPGVFDTPMLSRLRGDIRDGIAQSVPHPKRLGDPADYAHLAVTLLENSYLNGETIRLDGAVRMAPR